MTLILRGLRASMEPGAVQYPGTWGEDVGPFEVPYGNSMLEVTSAGYPGMLWYELREDRERRTANQDTQAASQPQAVQQPQGLPLPSPSPGPSPTPPAPSAPTSSAGNGGLWSAIGGGLLILGGAGLIAGTVAEDFATAGIGVLDDPLTIGAGAAGIGEGWGLVASAFALAA